jgi:hypothetical protein
MNIVDRHRTQADPTPSLCDRRSGSNRANERGVALRPARTLCGPGRTLLSVRPGRSGVGYRRELKPSQRSIGA